MTEYIRAGDRDTSRLADRLDYASDCALCWERTPHTLAAHDADREQAGWSFREIRTAYDAANAGDREEEEHWPPGYDLVLLGRILPDGTIVPPDQSVE